MSGTGEPSTATVEVMGEIDGLTAPALLARLYAELDAGARTVVVDLSGVRFCGVAGLHALCEARAHAHRLGAEVYLSVPSRVVARLLTYAHRVQMDPELPSWVDERALPQP